MQRRTRDRGRPVRVLTRGFSPDCGPRATHSCIHFERRTSKLPQAGQLWCWTSKTVSHARQTYGSCFSSSSERPDTSLALSSTPITTTRGKREVRLKRGLIVYAIFCHPRLAVSRFLVASPIGGTKPTLVPDKSGFLLLEIRYVTATSTGDGAPIAPTLIPEILRYRVFNIR